jgi:hypothetical protein
MFEKLARLVNEDRDDSDGNSDRAEGREEQDRFDDALTEMATHAVRETAARIYGHVG